MGMGKAVLVTDAPEASRFPEDACLRVAMGIEERDSLRGYMTLLTSIPDAARAIGLRGATHIRERHRVDLTAQQYWDSLCEYRG